MTTIAIVGLGVVGGSIALALKESCQENERIVAIDTNRKTLKKALDQGAIDVGETENKTLLQEADIVFLCIYPKAIRPFLERHQDDFKNGAIITDVAGVKQALYEDIKNVIPENIDFIFGHPMAGREKTGFDFADASVLQGANYLITERPDNNPKNIDILRQLIQRLGFKRITNVSMEQHDAMISFTSQLTHAIAVALVNSDEDYQETVKFVGDSYRDLTRIAKINAPLWAELFLANRYELIHSIDLFLKEMIDIRQALINENGEQLICRFEESTKRREYFDEMDQKNL